jgi:general stress protein 26
MSGPEPMGNGLAGQFFDALEDLPAGFLSVTDAGGTARPMTHYPDRSAAALWFFTSAGTALAAETGIGRQARFLVMDTGRGFYACVSGTLEPSQDDAARDRLWNPVVAAWFGGKNDPDLVLLRMTLQEGEIWTSLDSRIQFGLEIARARLVPGARPDLGTHETFRF